MKEDRVPARRKSMRKTKEVLRLSFELGLGQRQIARSCGMGLGTGPRVSGTGGGSRDRLAVAGRLGRRRTGSKAVWEPARAGRSGATAVATAPRRKGQTSAALFALLRQEKRPRPPRLSWANSLRKHFGVDPLVDSGGHTMHWIGQLSPVAS